MYSFFSILKTVFEQKKIFCSTIYNIDCNARYIVCVCVTYFHVFEYIFHRRGQ